jgi:hypothetical protein
MTQGFKGTSFIRLKPAFRNRRLPEEQRLLASFIETCFAQDSGSAWGLLAMVYSCFLVVLGVVEVLIAC